MLKRNRKTFGMPPPTRTNLPVRNLSYLTASSQQGVCQGLKLCSAPQFSSPWAELNDPCWCLPAQGVLTPLELCVSPGCLLQLADCCSGLQPPSFAGWRWQQLQGLAESCRSTAQPEHAPVQQSAGTEVSKRCAPMGVEHWTVYVRTTVLMKWGKVSSQSWWACLPL